MERLDTRKRALRDKNLRERQLAWYVDSMQRPIAKLAVIGCAVAGVMSMATGCGTPPQHPLTLVAFKNMCAINDTGCSPYLGCEDLGITQLAIEVGLFSRETTTVSCPASLTSGSTQSSVQVMVPYQPGQDFYTIDASFPREGGTVYLNAGPFTEDNGQTPWKLLLR